MSFDNTSNKISFFENIFYWLWFYFQKVIPSQGMPPPMVACTITSVFKAFNFFFAITLISVCIDYNIFTLIDFLSGNGGKTACIIILIPVALLVKHIDEKMYLDKFDFIREKIDILSPNIVCKKRKIFFIYLALTAISTALVPWMSIEFLLKK